MLVDTDSGISHVEQYTTVDKIILIYEQDILTRRACQLLIYEKRVL